MKNFLLTVLLALLPLTANAQIGYQVALLNNATGEPRANETVSVEVAITDSENNVVCTQTQSATTNEFGILSLQVGNASSFDNADWSKLPFFISATVDGIMLGKTQILNVPVAEYSKRSGVLTKEILMSKTWELSLSEQLTYQHESLNFTETEATYIAIDRYDEYISQSTHSSEYYIDGNFVILKNIYKNSPAMFYYIQETNTLVKLAGFSFGIASPGFK